MGVEILRMMGAIPKGSFGLKMRLVKDLIFLKSYFARHSDPNILAIPLLKDKRLEMIMELLRVAGIHSFYCGAMLDHVSMISRGLVMSLTKGLLPASGVHMSGHSLFCTALNDMKGARRFSHLAGEILDMTKAREQACIHVYVATSFIHEWQNPPNQVMDLFESGHKLGMESGDFEHAILCYLAAYHHAFIIGRSIADVEMKYLSAMKKLRLYNITYVHSFAEALLPVFQYLRGTAEKDFDPTFLADYGPSGTSEGSPDYYCLMCGYNARLQLAVYFNSDDLALHSLQGLDLISADSEAGFCFQSVRLCFSSLAYSTLYRNRRKRSYLNKSKRYLQQLKRICRIKGTVCLHRCVLMEAHLEAVRGRQSTSSVLVAFDHAIQVASSNGYVHDAALGAQLAAEYCVCVMQHIPNEDSLEFTTMATLLHRYLQQAKDLYKSWGAMALISHLENKHG